MTRGVAGWWPHVDEDWAAFSKRTARHAEALRRDAKIPPMRRGHRVVVVDAGGPHGSLVTEARRQVVRERIIVATRMVANDAARSPTTAFGPDTATPQQRTWLLRPR